MKYRIPGTESDPEVPQVLYDVAEQEIHRAAEESGVTPKDVAVSYIANLLAQRDKLSGEVDAGMIDIKTGVLSDRAFRQQAEAALLGLQHGRRKQDRANSALAYEFDIEDFGKFNKRFGHAAGNKQLKAVGDFLANAIRTDGGDLVGRIGGDEFAIVIFYDHDQVRHEAILEEIEERIANPLRERYTDLPLLSWNHAFFSGTESLEQLLKSGDVKGDPLEEGLVRLHSQTYQERMASYTKALSKSLPPLE